VDPRYPLVATTFRLTEQHTAGETPEDAIHWPAQQAPGDHAEQYHLRRGARAVQAELVADGGRRIAVSRSSFVDVTHCGFSFSG